MAKKIKHRAVSRTWEYWDDCVLYKVTCSCGKVIGEWAIKDAEKVFAKYIKETK